MSLWVGEVASLGRVVGRPTYSGCGASPRMLGSTAVCTANSQATSARRVHPRAARPSARGSCAVRSWTGRATRAIQRLEQGGGERTHIGPLRQSRHLPVAELHDQPLVTTSLRHVHGEQPALHPHRDTTEGAQGRGEPWGRSTRPVETVRPDALRRARPASAGSCPLARRSRL
jgi:hypothetical protein